MIHIGQNMICGKCNSNLNVLMLNFKRTVLNCIGLGVGCEIVKSIGFVLDACFCTSCNMVSCLKIHFKRWSCVLNILCTLTEVSVPFAYVIWKVWFGILLTVSDDGQGAL